MYGDGRVFQRGNQWWIAYYVKQAGRSIEQRERGGETEKQAKKKLKHRLKELAAHSLGAYTFLGPAAERLTVEQLLDALQRHYQTAGKEQKKSASHMKHLRAFFGYELAPKVTGQTVERYITFRQGETAANSTINRELHILRRAFTLAVKHKLLAKTHVPEFLTLEEHVREGYTQKGDLDAVLSHLKDANVRDCVEWAFWSGMRRGEIGKLTWAAVDLETSTLSLSRTITKTKATRKLALEGIYREIIARRAKARRLDCPLIFHRQGKPMGQFRKAWTYACDKAGVSGLIFHDLRRSAIRNMVKAGVSEKVAMQISGHATRSVFERYNITDEADLRMAQRQTEEYVSALPTTSNVAPLARTRKTSRS